MHHPSQQENKLQVEIQTFHDAVAARYAFVRGTNVVPNEKRINPAGYSTRAMSEIQKNPKTKNKNGTKMDPAKR